MKVKKTIDLPHDDLQWYYENYTDYSLSATMTMLLHNFRSIHQDTGVTPIRVARDAAKETKEMISDIKAQKA